MIPKTMHAVLLCGHGGPEMLEYHDAIDVPQPAKTDVLIRVDAAGVNNTDINTRIAWYSKSGDQQEEDATWSGKPLELPRIQGADVCGHIVAVGQDVSPDRIGERILIEPCLRECEGRILDIPWYFGSECDGGFAQYCVVASRHAHKITSNLSSIELASFPCSYSTAENMLTRSNLQSGETVLITGASGGVGSGAVQLAKARGARVIALTSADKMEKIEHLGADLALDRKGELLKSIEKNTVDVVIDLVGGPAWPELLEVLRPGGRYAVSGAIAGADVPLDLRTLYLKDLSFFGCTVLEDTVFANLIQHIEQGNIKPLVADTYPLTEIQNAQAAFQDKNHVGKIVLTIP